MRHLALLTGAVLLLTTGPMAAQSRISDLQAVANQAGASVAPLNIAPPNPDPDIDLNRDAAASRFKGPTNTQTDASTKTSRGVVHPRQSATLASAITARITGIPFIEGDRFEAGDVLVSFDCAKAKAELRSANAAHKAESKTAKMQKKLLAMKATGKSEAQIANARAVESRERARAIAQQVKQCSIKAPFNGRVAQLIAQPFETPPANEPLMRIISDRELELHMVVSSRWLQWLRKGTPFSFKVDETGNTHQAVIKRVAATVDAVSQTVRVVGVFNQHPDQVLPGMSGAAQFDQTQVQPQAKADTRKDAN